MKRRFNKSLPLRLVAVLSLTAFAGVAGAVEYRSVAAKAAILFDAPSQKGARQYIIRQHSPVELVVNLEGWAKVRDAEGGLAWIERKDLGEARTVQVTASRALVRKAPAAEAPLLFEAEQGVALEFVESVADGWVKVRPVGGTEVETGFVRILQVWGA